MEMQSSKVIMMLWVRWKVHAKSDITLDPKDVDCTQDIGGNTSDEYIKLDALWPLDNSILNAAMWKSCNNVYLPISRCKWKPFECLRSLLHRIKSCFYISTFIS